MRGTALKFQTLKNEMERALMDAGFDVPKDARVGDRAVRAMMEYASAYIRASTKFAIKIAGDMTGRTTLKDVEIKIAVGAVKLADIEQELPEKGKTT